VYAIIGFSRVHISQEVAERFNTLTLHSRVPLSEHARGPVFDGDQAAELPEVERLRQQLMVYEELLDEHELRVREQSFAIEKRAQEMRLILDNVNQGLLMLNRSGVVEGQSSLVVKEWLGCDPAGQHLQDMRQLSEAFREEFGFGWDALIEGIMPTELCVDQLPQRFEVGERTFRLGYQVIADKGDKTQGCLVVITDITAELAAQRERGYESELARLLSQAVEDSKSVLDFVREIDSRLSSLRAESDDAGACARQLHTIKGNRAPKLPPITNSTGLSSSS
jgi:hypothetical protein